MLFRGGGHFFPLIWGSLWLPLGRYKRRRPGAPESGEGYLLSTGRRYSMDPKLELLNLLHELSSEQLQLVLDYTRSLQGDFDQEAFDYVLDHYDETLNKLTDEEDS